MHGQRAEPGESAHKHGPLDEDGRQPCDGVGLVPVVHRLDARIVLLLRLPLVRARPLRPATGDQSKHAIVTWQVCFSSHPGHAHNTHRDMQASMSISHMCMYRAVKSSVKCGCVHGDKQIMDQLAVVGAHRDLFPVPVRRLLHVWPCKLRGQMPAYQILLLGASSGQTHLQCSQSSAHTDSLRVFFIAHSWTGNIIKRIATVVAMMAAHLRNRQA